MPPVPKNTPESTPEDRTSPITDPTGQIFMKESADHTEIFYPRGVTVEGEYFDLYRLESPNCQPIAHMLEFESRETQEGWQNVVPTVDRLNTLRQEKLGETSANQFPFVMHEGGLIDAGEYLGYFAEGKIPIASDPGYRHHDYYHAFGFSLLSSEIMKLVRDASERALTESNPLTIKRLLFTLDYFSALSADKQGNIPALNDTIIPTGIGGATKLKQVALRQQALAAQIRNLATPKA